MVKPLIFPLLIVFCSFAYAQEKVSKSRIRFIDGSEVRAVIKENFPGKYVKIVLPDNEEVTIKYVNILSIKHEDYKYYSRYIPVKGFYIEGMYSFLFGKASEYGGSRLGVALGASTNYQLNSHISVGVGVEPTAILITNENFFIPVYAHFKLTLLERRITPVLMLDAGWSFVLNNNNESTNIKNDGGWYTRPSIGLQINNFTLSLGYQLQKITTTRENNWWTNQITVEERMMKNVTISGNYRF